MTPAAEPRVIRFIDLCAGLGGFHHGAHLAGAESAEGVRFECVLAAEADDELRGVYPRNFGAELETSYRRHYPPELCHEHPAMADLWDEQGRLVRVHGRLEGLLDPWTGPDGEAQPMVVPPHDLLMAGFPCQPFSKSGAQLGFMDEGDGGRGTVFQLIARIIEVRKPQYVLLENVGNFPKHDDGETWRTVRDWLSREYDVFATPHAGNRGGEGLLSPHLFGLPHHRERFFICAERRTQARRTTSPIPRTYRSIPDRDLQRARRAEVEDEASRALAAIVAESALHAPEEDFRKAQLSASQVECIAHWQEWLDRIDKLGSTVESNPLRPLPGFPIWGFELDPWHHYPFDCEHPPAVSFTDMELQAFRRKATARAKRLGLAAPARGSNPQHFHRQPPEKWIASWPRYAAKRYAWPRWKRRFIAQNRDFAWSLLAAFSESGDLEWYRDWLDRLHDLPASFQKFEWNSHGEPLDLSRLILQFRPSGLRAKRFRHVPALVALTTTQVPIVPRPKGEPLHWGVPGSQSRFLLPGEAKRLQGLDRDWFLPGVHARSFKALGNAVHAEVVSRILRKWVCGDEAIQTTGFEEQLALPL